MRDQKHTTRVLKNNTNPKYDESFAFQLYDSKDELCITFYDFDRISDDEPIGYVNISMSDFDMMGGEVCTQKWFDLHGGTRDMSAESTKITGRVCLSLHFLPLAQDSDSDVSDDEGEDEEVKAENDGTNKNTTMSAPPGLKKPKLKDNTPTKLLNHHQHETPHMGTLEITIKRARNVRKVGFMGTNLPDTYIKLRIEKHRFKTKMIKNECDPVYDDVFEFLIDDASEAVRVCRV